MSTLPEIEPRHLGLAVRSLVTISTKVSRIQYVKCAEGQFLFWCQYTVEAEVFQRK